MRQLTCGWAGCGAPVPSLWLGAKMRNHNIRKIFATAPAASSFVYWIYTYISKSRKGAFLSRIRLKNAPTFFIH